jgi:hypothetical protein
MSTFVKDMVVSNSTLISFKLLLKRNFWFSLFVDLAYFFFIVVCVAIIWNLVWIGDKLSKTYLDGGGTMHICRKD